ncbi:hypothetical protein PV326_007473, partial [Microctonus aethiopoides]
ELPEPKTVPVAPILWHIATIPPAAVAPPPSALIIEAAKLPAAIPADVNPMIVTTNGTVNIVRTIPAPIIIILMNIPIVFRDTSLNVNVFVTELTTAINKLTKATI